MTIQYIFLNNFDLLFNFFIWNCKRSDCFFVNLRYKRVWRLIFRITRCLIYFHFSPRIQYDDPSAYSDAMHSPQMSLMQQAQQQNHVMGPPQQQVYPTINQNQISSQLGLQIGMGPAHQPPGTMSGSPTGSNQNSPGLETSEDSDDSTPLAQVNNTFHFLSVIMHSTVITSIHFIYFNLLSFCVHKKVSKNFRFPVFDGFMHSGESPELRFH